MQQRTDDDIFKDVCGAVSIGLENDSGYRHGVRDIRDWRPLLEAIRRDDYKHIDTEADDEARDPKSQS